MDGISTLTNGITTATGSTAKANILISDKRDTLDADYKKKKAVAPGSGSVGGVGGISVPGGVNLQNLAEKASNVANTVGNVASGVLDTMGYDVNSRIGGDSEYNKMFTVQFNPASFSISGFSGGSYDTQDFRAAGKSAKATPMDLTYSLNVTLIFDQMELQNSFPLDMLNTALVTEGMQAAWKGLETLTSGLSISVQSATEGLIASLQNPRTRLVCFEWGTMRYKGVMKSVNANYKMFDMMGRPVRSEVALSLYLADDAIKGSGGKSNLGMWANAYKKAFLDAKAGGALAAKKVKDISKTVLGD